MLLAVAGLEEDEIAERTRRLAEGDWSSFTAGERAAFAFARKQAKSVASITQADVDSLVAEGLLERRRGSGTFVAFRPVLRVLGLTSFSQDMRSRGLIPSSRVLEFRTIEADTALRLVPGSWFKV